MREVAYLTVADVDSAIAALCAHENAMLLAGGTNVVDYLRAGVISPSVLIDISAVPLTGVHAGEAGFTVTQHLPRHHYDGAPKAQHQGIEGSRISEQHADDQFLIADVGVVKVSHRRFVRS